MQGKTAELMRAISNNDGQAVTLDEAAALIGTLPNRVGVMLWWLTERGYLVKLPGFPWWAQRWGTPRTWGRWRP